MLEYQKVRQVWTLQYGGAYKFEFFYNPWIEIMKDKKILCYVYFLRRMTDWVDQNYVGMGIFSTIMSTVWIVMGFIALEACSDITASGLSISEGQILVLYLIGKKDRKNDS